MLKRNWRVILVVCGLILALTPNLYGADKVLFPYQDPQLPIEERVEDLLSRMTLAEKVGQMTQIEVARLMGRDQWDRGPLNNTWLRNILRDNVVGSVFSGGGSAPVPNTPRDWAEMTNAIQAYALEHSRLRIPIIYGVDAVHGHNTVLGATIYPHNIGLAATWNPELVRKVAEAAANDVAATGVHWNFAPVGDLGLDMRWGRFYETFGEDPYLAGEMAAASVAGFQSEPRVAATAKHFVGYSEPEQGKDRANAELSLRSLREVHFPPFEKMIEAGVATFMPNSGTVNGVPVHASHYLLTEVLRNQMGFDGVVVSDWEDIVKLYSTYRITDNYRDAIRLSVNAGVDMSMVPHDAKGFTSNLISLVEDGLVSEERIDEAVRRILTLKFKLGLFENPFVDPEQADKVILNANRDLAKRAALESMTLLKNKNNILPLAKTTGSILLVGSNAHSITSQMGGWTIGWQGADNPWELPPAVTVRDGLLAALPKADIHFTADLNRALQLADEAEVVIVVAGEGAYAEMHGDNLEPSLNQADKDLIKALSAEGKRIVLVLIGGRPLLITDIVDQVDAILMAFYPGTEGGSAVADVLLGSYNPSGKLPFSWPQSTAQLPQRYNHWITSSYDPLYPFGWGLSYTSFSYSNLKVSNRVKLGETVEVSVRVENRGKMVGEEVVQLYLSPSHGPTLPRQRSLVGFAKIQLEPGERKTVTFQLGFQELASIHGDILGDGEKAVAPGEYTVSVGGLQNKFKITP